MRTFDLSKVWVGQIDPCVCNNPLFLGHYNNKTGDTASTILNLASLGHTSNVTLGKNDENEEEVGA